mmetsp:Transcript_16170/g.24416  ORF Transcript_16170/g.24416 Transcript_16170/m.24416 type:complete len:101 (-) Transcript_16170:1285-1587(-)
MTKCDYTQDERNLNRRPHFQLRVPVLVTTCRPLHLKRERPELLILDKMLRVAHERKRVYFYGGIRGKLIVLDRPLASCSKVTHIVVSCFLVQSLRQKSVS